MKTLTGYDQDVVLSHLVNILGVSKVLEEWLESFVEGDTVLTVYSMFEFIERESKLLTSIIKDDNEFESIQEAAKNIEHGLKVNYMLKEVTK